MNQGACGKMNNLLSHIEHRQPRNIYSEIEKLSRETGEEVWIWGTGSVAAGITRQIQSNTNIQSFGYFVDVVNWKCPIDNRILIGNPTIVTLDELIKRGQKIIVIVGHSRYELVGKMTRLEIVDRVFLVPATARIDDGIDYDFLINNITKFEKAYALLSDLKSRQNMIAFLNAKVNKDETFIDANRIDGYFDNDVITTTPYESLIDVGAYCGENTDLFLNSQSEYTSIILIEVLQEEYRNLVKKYARFPKIHVENTGISNHDGFDNFEIDAQSTCLSKSGGLQFPVETLDHFVAKRNIDPTIIKICIGSSILPVLEGARSIIHGGKAVFIIHMGIDKYAFVHYLQFLNAASGGQYAFFLRFTSAMSEALVLYALPLTRLNNQ